MNAIVTIAGTDLTKIEYRGQQVVTLAMIDKVHGRVDGTAGRTFRENRSRFVEGDDFIEVDQPDEIRRLGFTRPQGGTPALVLLITRRGYLKITKSLNDDRAWEVFDEMVERYFAIIRDDPQFQVPQTFADALRLAAKQSEQLEKQALVISEMAPKAGFHDDVASAINAQDFQAVAKVLGTGRTRFMEWLRSRGFLMESNRPYQRYEDAGYFRVIERYRKDQQTGEKITYTKTLVTGKGLTYLHKKWLEDHPSTEELI